MKRFYWSHLILAVVAVAAIAVVAEQPAPPVVHAQVPGGTCVLEAVQQATGFSLPFSCEDRGRFSTTAPTLTGSVPCTAPTAPNTMVMYVTINGQCFQVTPMWAPGSQAYLPPGVTLPKGGPMTTAQLAFMLRQAEAQHQAHPAK